MTKIRLSSSGYTVLVLALIALIIVGPLATIWSLNTLFNLDIAYNFWTWLAMAWLSMVTVGSINHTIKNRNQ